MAYEMLKVVPVGKLLEGYVYQQWPPPQEADSFRVIKLSTLAHSVASSCGTVASAASAGYLATRAVFVTQRSVADALVARPFDAAGILGHAGGRIGLRSAVYFGAIKAAAYVSSEALFTKDPVRVLLMVPAGFFVAMFGFPVYLPVLGVGWAGGRLVGASLGRHAASFLGRPNSSAASLVHGGLYAHRIDRHFAGRPFAATVLAVLAPMALLVDDPDAGDGEHRGGSSGGGGSGGVHGHTWRYEKRFSSGAGTEQVPAPQDDGGAAPHDPREAGERPRGGKGRGGGGGEWV